MAKKNNKRDMKRSTADVYSSILFMRPSECAKAHTIINQIVINSESKKKKTYQALVYIKINGKTQSFTRHVPFTVMNMIRSNTKINVVHRKQEKEAA